MEKAYREIRREIEKTRKKRAGVARRRIAFIAISAAVAALALAAFALPAIEGPARLVLRAIILAVLFGAIPAAIVAAIIKREGIEAAALAIERANPHLNNRLINSVQLMRARSEPGPRGAFSHAFLDKHLEATARAVEAVDFQAAAPARPAKLPAAVCAALLVAFAIGYLVSPQRSGQGVAGIFTEPWSTPGQAADMVAMPLTLGDFTIHYRFPAYSGIEPLVVPNSSGDLAGLKGASVIIETRSLERLDSAWLVTKRGDRYMMDVTDGHGHDLKVEIVLDRPDQYSIEGMDVNDAKRADPKWRRILVDEDLPPAITMLTPAGDVEVAAEGVLEISYQSSDDFGVSRVELVYSLDGEEKRLKPLATSKRGKKIMNGEYKWTIADMDFEPGARIPFFLEAVDNDEVSGGNVGRSETRLLEIFSARKLHQKLLARQDQLLDMMVDHLAQVLMAPPVKEDSPIEEIKKTESGLLDTLAGLIDFTAMLHIDMLEDEYADELALEALEDMERRYRLSQDGRQTLIGQPRMTRAARARLSALRDEFRFDLENDILFLDKLIKKQRIDDLLAEADDLYKAQAELADLLEQFKRTGDPALLDALRKAMARLERAWADLMARMAEMRKDMPEEFINADAFKGETASGLSDEMEKLRKALADGDMEAVLEMAEQFLSMMDKWMSSLEDSAGGYKDMLSKELMDRMRDIKERIDEMVEREQDIETELREIHDRALEKLAERDSLADGPTWREKVEQDVAEMLAEFQKDMDRTRDSLYNLRPQSPDGRPRPTTPRFDRERQKEARNLRDIERGAEHIRRMVGKGDLEDAREMAESLEERLKSAEQRAESFKKKNQAGPESEWEQLKKSTGECKAGMNGISKYLDEAGRRLAGALGEGDRARLGDLEGTQQSLRDEAQKLIEDYEQLREDAPILPGEVSEYMDKAAFHMYDAAGQMALDDPERAMPEARKARASLEQAGESLGEAQKKCMKAGMGQGMTGMGTRMPGDGDGGRPDTDDVGIPGEDAYQVPEEFREELLKAMKEDSPDAYKNLNKDYYERLVR